MASFPQKLRILYVMKILLTETDEDHVLSANEICRRLAQYGISAERKAIYSDLDILEQFGIDIVRVDGGGCCVGARDFELPELKLLVDAVQASKFITEKKSAELIGKLEMLTSRYNAARLDRQVFIRNRIKTENETIYYTVDRIHEAISSNVQLSFLYCEWTTEKTLRPRKNGARYVASPWALTWDNEKYYLVAYHEPDGSIRHYRVDKMKELELLAKPRLGRENFQGFDLAAFARKTFGMYGGQEEQVLLRGKADLVGIVIDRFGSDIMIVPEEGGFFHTTVPVAVSNQFFGWIAAIGGGLRIAGPDSVKSSYRSFLQSALDKSIS